MRVSAVNVYPVKSMRGSAVPEALVCRYGLQHDRQWMLVDDAAKMITQRECPPLATVLALADSAGLQIRSPGRADIHIPPNGTNWTQDEIVVDVWGHSYVGVAAALSINQALSEAIGMTCKLLSIRADVFRLKHEVAFHDSAPIHIISESTLDDLNARLDTPLPMNRFRPNIVVSGAGPYEEDSWQRVAIGDTIFRAVKPCERCVITTVDQAIGVMRGPEPLKTLATFRRKGDGVAFGHYYRPEEPGATVRLDDAVTVLSATAAT